ncbi:NACHT domain-containing NTPase [Streptomyces sp. CoH27]|uniref:NACHT domain-containing protein n=1 Tax=Streptomyces sp. CoH27 TaxID=2875763 RepID=UPI001CD5B449|nr:NACHT domain-containing protein [Streptomyces sp. CoH27]
MLSTDAQFRNVLERADVAHFFTQLAGANPSNTAEFEDRYRQYVISKYGTLTIFGIDLTDRSHAEWPLDAAYLSLEASGSEDPIGSRPPDGLATKLQGQAQPADRALAGHERVLLRGVAGSGKTTLVQWLAVSAAKQELGEHLGHLQGRIPIVLPLRTLIRYGELPLPAEFLAAVRSPLVGIQPEGWVENILATKRGLLLVDGIDEISERDRERVREWLRELMLAFPGNMWLVTSRPSAVTDSWLSSEGFIELSLHAMGRSEVAAFVHRWHTAAISTCRDDEEIKRLAVYESALITAIRTKQDLGRLATNPLMCGLICALHRDRRGYLPAGRKQLYDAALSMLIARRDRERDLDVRLDEESQIQLLQKLAYWLIKNGQVEMDRADALDLISAALPAIPSVAELGTPSQIYNYLLLRSGLLREPVQGVVDFVHRTFQDYLGAKAAVEERDFDLMVRNAHHDQWEDVIRMAVAHAYPAERARILNKLIKRGDRTKTHRTRLHLLAMACLEHATELDASVRSAVEERAARLIPPEDHDAAEALASAGPMVLDLLPGPESLTEEQAYAVVLTATLVGSDAALPILAKFRGSTDTSVQDTLVREWRNFDFDQYGRDIIAYLPEDQLFWAYSTKELRFLKELGGRKQVIFNGNAPVDTLRDLFPGDGPTTLGLHENAEIEDLSGFPLGRLENLYLYNCPRFHDLSPLQQSDNLAELSINKMKGLYDLRGLDFLTSLTELSIFQPVAGLALSSLPKNGRLEWLALCEGAVESTGLRGLRDCGTLKTLVLRLRDPGSRGTPVVEDALPVDWGEISAHPSLESIRLDGALLQLLLHSAIQLPRIRHLALDFARGDALTAEESRAITRVFPGLRKVSGYFGDDEIREIENVMPDLEVGDILEPVLRDDRD